MEITGTSSGKDGRLATLSETKTNRNVNSKEEIILPLIFILPV